MSESEFSDRGRVRSAYAGGALASAAKRTVDQVVRVGAEDYDRSRHLPRLIAIDPVLIEDRSDGVRRLILAKLARALRAERNRGRAGHWTYDLNRHIGLKQAYAAEKRMAGNAIASTPCA